AALRLPPQVLIDEPEHVTLRRVEQFRVSEHGVVRREREPPEATSELDSRDVLAVAGDSDANDAHCSPLMTHPRPRGDAKLERLPPRGTLRRRGRFRKRWTGLARTSLLRPWPLPTPVSRRGGCGSPPVVLPPRRAARQARPALPPPRPSSD